MNVAVGLAQVFDLDFIKPAVIKDCLDGRGQLILRPVTAQRRLWEGNASRRDGETGVVFNAVGAVLLEADIEDLALISLWTSEDDDVKILAAAEGLGVRVVGELHLLEAGQIHPLVLIVDQTLGGIKEG